MENFGTVGKLGVVENNNKRLTVIGSHDEKLWNSRKVLGDLSRDRKFRRSEKFSTTGGNSKEERLTMRKNNIQHASLQQTPIDFKTCLKMMKETQQLESIDLQYEPW
jgi:hypothetical protein